MRWEDELTAHLKLLGAGLGAPLERGYFVWDKQSRRLIRVASPRIAAGRQVVIIDVPTLVGLGVSKRVLGTRESLLIYIFENGEGLNGELVGWSSAESGTCRSWAKYVLLLLPKKNREHLIGDLEEEYRMIILPEFGRFRANLWYWVQTAQAVGFYVWPFLKRVLGMVAIGKLIGR